MEYKQKKTVEELKHTETVCKTMEQNMGKELALGQHQMSIFGDEFEKESFCWRVDDELWLSMIIVKKGCRMQGALHRLLEAAKERCSIVVIPEPLGVVPRVAAKHGYLPSTRWIEDYDENINVMVWQECNISSGVI